MQVVINLPNDFAEIHTVSVVEREMRVSYALALSKAAELAGLNVYDRMG